jgi:chromosome segregation ATPase
MTLTAETVATAENNPISDVEAQMRRALGLFGGMRQRTDNDRGDQQTRMTDRFGPQGGNQGLHRRRFVQDGEVPVTVVRRDSVADAAAPQSSRLQRTEATLAAETAARERAERALHDAQAQVAALQTKIGHAELARVEAVDIARRERDANAQVRATSDGAEEQLQAMQEQVDTAEHAKRYAQAALAEERTARKTAERALREITERAEQAEAALRLLEQETELDDTVALQPLRNTAVRYGEGKTPARRGRPPGSKAAVKPAIAASSEAEPVKWWLMPSGKAKAR